MGTFNLLFPSVFFLTYYLPVALALYWACGFSITAQNICLLVFSLLFYTWGEPLYLVPMLFLIVVNHLLGGRLGSNPEPAEKRRIVRLAVILNVATLVLVRYGGWAIGVFAGFAGDWVLAFTGFEIPVVSTRFPVGVSFWVLQALSYIFEIARGKARPERSILNTALYVSFLPTVLFGPILGFGDFAPQLRERKVTMESLGMGCERVITGLAKLMLLAAPIGQVADLVFSRSASGRQFFETPVLMAWFGLVAYALQFYLSFSGYSDMAIGIARLFGFSLKENFKHPYTAHTVTDFWNRWHISLFRWFYVYVFLSMGGSRPKRVRIRGVLRPHNFVVRNMLVLWLLIGFWHGIGWNHLVFGLLFFTICILEWIVSLQRRDTGNPLWNVYVLFVVSLAWVFIRCVSFSESLNYLSNLLGLNHNGLYSDMLLVLVRENWLVLLLGVVFSTPLGAKIMGLLEVERGGAVGWLLLVFHVAVYMALFVLSLVYLSRTGGIVPLPFY